MASRGKLMSFPHMQARTNAEKLQAMEIGVLHFKKHLEWHKATEFMGPKDLQAWHRYCDVPGLHDGFVVLRLNVGALLNEVCPCLCLAFLW
jgi:hypothetical protein